MFIIVTYDVNVKRVSKVMKTCRKYLSHEQNSVFEGILTRKDYTLLFDNEDGKRYLPVETTESISIYSNVIIASDVLKFLSDKNIYLSVVNKYGDIVGHFCGQGAAARSRTMVKQMSVYLDDKRRLELARKMERAFIHNIKANLNYYCRRSKSEAIAAWLYTFRI